MISLKTHFANSAKSTALPVASTLTLECRHACTACAYRIPTLLLIPHDSRRAVRNVFTSPLCFSSSSARFSIVSPWHISMSETARANRASFPVHFVILFGVNGVNGDKDGASEFLREDSKRWVTYGLILSEGSTTSRILSLVQFPWSQPVEEKCNTPHASIKHSSTRCRVCISNQEGAWYSASP